ncbi:MAG: cohesin domain-containing protein [Methanoregula sp.]
MKHCIQKTYPARYVLFYLLAIALILVPVVGAEGLEVSVLDQSVTTGSSIIFPVSVRNAEELFDANLEISYDPAVLTFTGIELGEISQNGIIEATETKPGTIVISLADTSGISQDGVLMKLLFNVKGSDGTSSPITITSKGLRNLDKNDVPANVKGGMIIVTGAGQKTPIAGYIPVIASIFAIGIFVFREREEK